MATREDVIRELAANAVRELGITPDQSYQWLLPPELIEDVWGPEDDRPRTLAGIPVRMEVLMGERLMVLVQTVAHLVVLDDPVPAL